MEQEKLSGLCLMSVHCNLFKEKWEWVYRTLDGSDRLQTRREWKIKEIQCAFLHYYWKMFDYFLRQTH
uniref:Uncharacterized protein n=1 Tax=Phlebotomus papatasi TaxID=29031 RepID=A0A1B0D8V5_PHLPP